MLIVVQVHDIFFSSSFFKNMIFESVLIPCEFTVLFFKMTIISNHNQSFFLQFHVFLYNKM